MKSTTHSTTHMTEVKNERKRDKYKPMIKALQRAGWNKKNIKFHCLTFDIAAYWNKKTVKELLLIGFNKKETDDIMKTSQDIAIKYIARQYHTRNKLVHNQMQ